MKSRLLEELRPVFIKTHFEVLGLECLHNGFSA